MAHKSRKLLLALIAGVVLAGFALLLLTRNPAASLPKPNGYDEFIRAGQMLTTTLDHHRNLGDYREVNLDELRMFASTNAEALEIAQAGLSLQSRIPVTYTKDWFRAHLDETSHMIHMGRMFCLAGRLAQLEGRTNDAINLILDSIRFAHESTRGGMITDASVMRTLEDLGMGGLQTMRDALDAQQSRQIGKALEEVDARQQPWGGFYRRDINYTLRAELSTMFSLKSWQIRQRFKIRFDQAETRRRQAILDYATRAYLLENGKRPEKIADLVPGYLKAIPQLPPNVTNLLSTP